MTESIEWKESYNIGIEEIDLQHKYFVSLIKRLSKAMKESNDNMFCQNLLNELVKYAQFHFVSEENFLYLMKYEHIDEHRNHHANLLGALGNQIGLFQISSISSEEIITFLWDWFVSHTQIEDRKFANK